MTLAAVVTAAGYGTRLGSDLPKALVRIAGEPLLVHAVRRMARVADRIAVTAPPTHLTEVAAALEHVETCAALFIVPGGDTRQASVAAGLEALDLGDQDIVLVHDAARAFQPVETMRAAVAAVEAGAAGAIPVVPVVDTLVTAPAADGALGDPVSRTLFRAVQTPQVFRAGPLLEAHAKAAHSDATDDATLVRRRGHRVVAVDGHEHGIKVTHASDLLVAAHIAGVSPDVAEDALR
ncbi:2-C-methyl-D-erythritol 4-phosphate cytidylyltransferase [Demequina lignilytica]|uniref:2-C-methyl-D-erythritol 4-phosphate cytidylyltransferase n=1 Tax=Demequina lignilytica TaxID=3051663 RepID=A0AB35MIQ6_9MICO|nr:2-C-methyl-D-erythritol 4-phosphate cytidylyltransferase [Demequina sp. SYSU T0a273]MDN4483535.1 2-C-methyl-D-erythritol 4-phosphate cytidylyltransferase [Demequina sp. SYSU T0a273]